MPLTVKTDVPLVELMVMAPSELTAPYTVRSYPLPKVKLPPLLMVNPTQYPVVLRVTVWPAAIVTVSSESGTWVGVQVAGLFQLPEVTLVMETGSPQSREGNKKIQKIRKGGVIRANLPFLSIDIFLLLNLVFYKF